MPVSAPPPKKRLAGNWLEAKWLGSTTTRFFELGRIALKWPPVSRTVCLAGVDPHHLYHVTYGSDSELRDALHTIYVKCGAVDLHVRGCGGDGTYYLKCSQPGLKHGPTKAVICVSPAQVEKGRVLGVESEALQPVVHGQVRDREDWEEVAGEEVEVDDWVEV